MPDSAPVVYGKYQLLELLARGGMAEVFKAKSHGVEGFEKVLVIKRILPDLSQNPQFVEMFINEAKIAVTLSHANIVQVFDLGRADDTYFIAMEYVAGYDLSTILARGKKYGLPLPPELGVYVVSEVAKGLDYAHRRRDANMRPLNIVHRDVSPQNVLLSYEGEVKLTDFGIAKARTTVERDEEEGLLKGKYAYMAPEQARGREVDARSDLFALGTVLYETLSGQNPFYRDSSYDTLKLVRAGECPPVRAAASEVPEELSQIVATAMSPRPEERHPNAGRLYEDLIQFLYSSGRRVGAHDLSRYLDELRAATEADRTVEDGDFAAALDVDGVVVHERQAKTPAEVPRGKSMTPGPRKKLSTQVPTSERRDVTAMVVHAGDGDPTPDSTIHSLIRRFGGTVVEQARSGDGRITSVLFGAADPDGHDTEAAARCALRVARAAEVSAPDGVESSLRIAVHAGRVHVEIGGDVLKDEAYDKLLDKARGLARRARRGHVMLTSAAEKPVRTLFSLVEAPDDPGGSFRVVGERSLAEAYGKFVGRRNELRRLGEILAFANKGRRRIVGVVGEAGSGKSRLLSETFRRLKLGGHDVGTYLTAIGRQSRDVPLSACQEMLRVVLGIDELDPEPLIRDKVARLRELGLTEPELRAVEQTLGLIDGGASARPGGRPLRAALARMATRLAEDRLTVFAFDGVDFMDDESQALLDSLLRDSRDTRLAIVLAYRPGFVNAWTDLPGYHELEVGPLSDEDVVRLTGSRLGAEEVPMDLLRDVTAKSGGNPLYVEEYLKALGDAGAVTLGDGKVTYRPEVAEVDVPKTLRGIVAARVARLGPVERQLLQVAAVVGARFAPEVLAEVAGEDASTVSRSLGVLESRGIVLRHGPSEYAFAHELVGEVMRDGLTLDGRKQLHGAVAAALERLYPQRVDELAERLAEHFRRAADRGKAIDYLVRAADRLENENALDGAIANLVRAIDMLGQTHTPDRDRVLSLYRRIGDLSFKSRDLDAGADRMAAAVELAEDLGRDEYVARFSLMRGRLLAFANRFQEGKKWLERAREVSKRLGDRELLRDVMLATAESEAKNGLYSSAVGLLREALALSRDTGDLRAQIRCLIPLALAIAAGGDAKEALSALEEARRLAGIHPDRFTDCDLLKTEALIHHYLRNHQGVVDASSRALELAKEYGFWYEAAVNSHNLGEGYLRLGDYKRAFANLRYSYELAREHGLARIEAMNLRVLGFIDAVRFNSLEGRRRVAETAEYALQNGFPWDHLQSLYLLGIADAALGDPVSARKSLRETMRLAAEHGDVRYREDAEAALKAIDAGEPVPMPS